MTHHGPRWQLGLLAAFALTLPSLIPQVHVWIERGQNWQGSYAAIQGDEWAYSAYVNALRDGRPRRNDPFAGNDNPHLPETIFSIQFIPAYAIALPARILGVSTSTAFIALMPITAFLSCVAVFWLIESIIGESGTAAAGALCVLCFGAFIIGQSVAGTPMGIRLHSGYLPFLRRYEPGLPFPLLFVFCALTWRAFTANRWKPYAIAAGAVLAVLVFSYFFLWTAALAWFVCFALLWFIVQGKQSRALGVCGTLAAVLLIPLLIYGNMLRSMGSDAETVQAMGLTHALDLFHPTEVLGALVLLLLGLTWWKRLIEVKDPAVLFVASCALTPFAVLNQQILTGRSLQPFHYELFALSYLLLTGCVILFYLCARAWKDYATILRMVAAVSLGWGTVEMGVMESSVARNPLLDEAAAVGRNLSVAPIGCVFSTNGYVANVLPTFAPQPVLWAHYHPVFNTPQGEFRERFFQYLYFTGYDGARLKEELLNPEHPDDNYNVFRFTLFGQARVFPHLGGNGAPVQLEDIEREVDRYSTYISRFSHVDAGRFPLAYVITPAEKETDLSNLEKWYNRDSGERIGAFMLYSVRLR